MSQVIVYLLNENTADISKAKGSFNGDLFTTLTPSFEGDPKSIEDRLLNVLKHSENRYSEYPTIIIREWGVQDENLAQDLVSKTHDATFFKQSSAEGIFLSPDKRREAISALEKGVTYDNLSSAIKASKLSPIAGAAISGIHELTNEIVDERRDYLTVKYTVMISFLIILLFMLVCNRNRIPGDIWIILFVTILVISVI